MENNNCSSGLGLCSILTIIFVMAKILGYVHFSWLVCFLPVIISLGLLLTILFVVLGFAGIAVYLNK